MAPLLRRLNFSLSQGCEFAIQRAIQHAFDGKNIESGEIQQICKLASAIFLHYYNFIQKQQFEKLYKLKESQMNLPIFSYKNQIVRAVEDNQIVIIAGDTGCGKSTQTPQYLLECGFKKLACTQPRRIAAISLAKRVAYETMSRHSDLVGYQIRFEKTVSKKTRLCFLTEGLLLRQFQSDPNLSNYDLIIMDEVHERHIYTDFMLGILLCLCRYRKDLKVVLMSATINVNLFSHYFDDAPVISVPGRLFPIELNYCPMVDEKKQFARNRSRQDDNDDIDNTSGGGGGLFDARPYVRILQSIDTKYASTERGDVLIFVSGLSAIAHLVSSLSSRKITLFYCLFLV